MKREGWRAEEENKKGEEKVGLESPVLGKSF